VDSKKKHTTHLSSIQEQLTMKAAEGPPTGTDRAYCTRNPHPYARERSSQETCSIEYGLCQKRVARQSRQSRRLFWQTPRKEPRAKTFRFVPALPAALAKTGMRPACRPLSTGRGGAGFAGLREADGLSSRGGGYDTGPELMASVAYPCRRLCAPSGNLLRIASYMQSFFIILQC
jgi:hypothetical protein